MVDRCVAKGLKAPEFHFDDEGQVIIWRKNAAQNVTPNVTPATIDNQGVTQNSNFAADKNVTPNVTPSKGAIRVKNILMELMANRYITTDELADKFKVASRTITRDINALRETYTIVWVPLSNTKGYWKVEHK